MSLTLPDLWQHLHRQLLPMLAEELGPLMRRWSWLENGRAPHERTWKFHAFLAKSLYQLPPPKHSSTRSRPGRPCASSAAASAIGRVQMNLVCPGMGTFTSGAGVSRVSGLGTSCSCEFIAISQVIS